MNNKQKIISFFLLLLTFYLLFSNFAYGKTIELYFFWGSGCPHCANMASVLKEINASYPTLKINTFEVWHSPANQTMLNAVAEGYNFKPAGVPVIFIGDKAIEGDSQTAIAQLKEAVKNCSISDCSSPIERIKLSKNKIQFNWSNLGILAGVIIFIFLLINLFKKKK
jgi:glutaredoxin